MLRPSDVPKQPSLKLFYSRMSILFSVIGASSYTVSSSVHV